MRTETSTSRCEFMDPNEHDEDSSQEQMVRDISDKHCPDSVRQSAYRELASRGSRPKKLRRKQTLSTETTTEGADNTLTRLSAP